MIVLLTSFHRLNDISIKMGGIDRNGVSYEGEFFGASKMYQHPDYDSENMVNDIALLKLSRKVDFSPYIRRICLNTALKGDLKDITGAGWGRTCNFFVSHHNFKTTIVIVHITSVNISFIYFHSSSEFLTVADANVCRFIHR